MKNIKLLLGALVALSGVASANAITASSYDLILGFSRTSGAGNATSLEVNLGSAASLVTASNGSEITLAGLSVLDLQNFGAGSLWQNSTTTWGVAGTSDGGEATLSPLWGTVKTGLLVGTPGANQGTPSNKIIGIYGDLSTQASTANSTSAVLVANAGNTNAWKNASASGFSYAPWNGKLTQTTNALLTTAFESAELYKFNAVGNGATADLLGTFKLYQDGHLTFAAAVIPEPSTYAALLGAACLGVAMLRRRRQQAMDLV